jgi:hypothetical protein
VFAETVLEEAAAYDVDVELKQDVFAGTELEGAATYGVDVELKQDVFDVTAGVETFVIEFIGITELVRTATEDVATIEVVFAGKDTVGAAAHAASPSRRQSVGKTAAVETLAALVVVFCKT